MLIYNYQKEFLGIDENDLKSLGFSDFAHLRNEAADFADFFVKTPGFIHNFKHVHWIDFVTCAEGNEDSKVIIHANGRNYRCTLDIRVAYLIDNPTQKAYLIHLMNLRALTHAENEQIAGDVLERPALKSSNETKAIFGTPEFLSDDLEDTETNDFEKEIHIANDPYETPIPEPSLESFYDDSPIDLGDDFLSNEEEIVVKEKKKPTLEIPKQKIETPKVSEEVLDVGSDYVYDPHLASDELGLPVDLIEEFIQDFISQANEFKDELYSSLKDNNISNLKILSHKLKGVAANLRVEDAFEVLTTINTSEDTEIIELNLNTLYIIINRLAGKSPQQEQVEEEQYPEKESVEDEVVLSSEDNIEVEEKVKEEETKVVPDIVIEAPVFEDEIFKTSENISNVEQKIEIPTTIDKEIELDYEDFIDDNDSFEEKSVEADEEVKAEPEIEQSLEVEEAEEEPEIEQSLEVEEAEEEPEIEQIYEVEEVEAEPEIEQIFEVEEVKEEPEIEETFEDVKSELEVKTEEPVEELIPELEVDLKSEMEEPLQEDSSEYEDLSYDKVLVANEIGIDLKIFNELFEDYILETSVSCANISKAIENGDVSSWQKNAIKLKGMSDNMRVHDIVAELKSIIHTSDANIAKKAVTIVSNKLQYISKTEV